MSAHATFLRVGAKTYQCLRCPTVVTERWANRTDARRAHAYPATYTEEGS